MASTKILYVKIRNLSLQMFIFLNLDYLFKMEIDYL